MEMNRICMIGLVYLTMLASTLHGSDPITELAVQDLSRPGPLPVPGWYFNPVDLNSGVGGDFIYAGWRRGTGAPITHLSFGLFNEGHSQNPWASSGWSWNPVDLNKGAGGRYIYMFWKSVPAGYRPIYDIAFTVTSSSSPPPLPGYDPIGVDLNAGAGGPYIFAYVSYDASHRGDASPKSIIGRGAPADSSYGPERAEASKKTE
jgi:hypothetical protein